MFVVLHTYILSAGIDSLTESDDRRRVVRSFFVFSHFFRPERNECVDAEGICLSFSFFLSFRSRREKKKKSGGLSLHPSLSNVYPTHVRSPLCRLHVVEGVSAGHTFLLVRLLAFLTLLLPTYIISANTHTYTNGFEACICHCSRSLPLSHLPPFPSHHRHCRRAVSNNDSRFVVAKSTTR